MGRTMNNESFSEEVLPNAATASEAEYRSLIYLDIGCC